MEFACTKVAIIKMEEHLMNLSCIFGVEPIETEDGLCITGGVRQNKEK